MNLSAPVYWLLAYLLGSLPFGLWVTRLVKGVDVRDGGSGHVTTTNTIRQAGRLAGAVVFVLDLGKGYLALWLSLQAGLGAGSLALSAALVVAGHCWPIFAQFRGGMGLATMGGVLLAVSPTGFLLSGVGLGILLIVLRHPARASLIAALASPLILRGLGFPSDAVWVAAAAGVVVAIRFTIDWNRKYPESGTDD